MKQRPICIQVLGIFDGLKLSSYKTVRNRQSRSGRRYKFQAIAFVPCAVLYVWQNSIVLIAELYVLISEIRKLKCAFVLADYSLKYQADEGLRPRSEIYWPVDNRLQDLADTR